jgi:acyl-CoA reductase-like NAD-dependent aldehyde dehydrogenase
MIESIVRDPKIKLVCFTGSVAGGLAVSKAAADRIVNVGLELGGKDPAYVRDDVDVAWAAEEIVDGAVFNSGQSCCSLERVYVDEKIYDSFLEAVQNVLKNYKLGDPLDKETVSTFPAIIGGLILTTASFYSMWVQLSRNVQRKP